MARVVFHQGQVAAAVPFSCEPSSLITAWCRGRVCTEPNQTPQALVARDTWSDLCALLLSLPRPPVPACPCLTLLPTSAHMCSPLAPLADSLHYTPALSL